MMNSEFVRLAKLLHAHGTKFMVVGGFAVNHYGYKRTTSDIDVYIEDSLENRRALIESLDEMGYGRMEPLINVPIIAGYCEIMMDDGFYVDLMTAIPGLDPKDYAVQYERRNIHLLDGVEIPYISYQDLLLNKEITVRDKDLDYKRNLEKLHSTGG